MNHLGFVSSDRRARMGAPVSLRDMLHAAFVVLASVSGTSSLRAQLAVEPLEVVIVPRVEDSRTFVVRNEAGKAIQASLTVEDWDRTDAGVNTFYPLGKGPGSCGGNIDVFPTVLRIEAGGTATVRVSLKDSASAPQGCWGIVFVQTQEPPAATPRQIEYAVRTGIKVYVEPPTLVREGGVENMTFGPHYDYDNRVVDSTRTDVVVTFRNTGGVQVKPHGSMEIRRHDNTLVAKVDITEFPVLPTSRRVLRVALPPLGKGSYVLLALLDYGGGELAAGQLEYDAR